MTDLGLQIIPVPFDDVGQLPNLLARLTTETTRTTHLDRLAASAWSDNSLQRVSPYCLALVANTAENLVREASACLKSFRTYWETGREWRTPAGSCLASIPLGPTGRLAFVYPGIASIYPGFADTLLTEYPETRQHLEQLIGGDPIKATRAPTTTDEIAALFADAVALGELGVLLTYAFTHVLRNHYRIHPTMALGYSLGEISMFASLGTWLHPEMLLERIRKWDVLRSCVNLRPLESQTSTDEWQTLVISAGPDRILQAIDAGIAVYMTHINTPNEVVVLGRASEVARLREQLSCAVTEQPVAFAFHAEPLHPLREELKQAYSLEVAQRPAIDFVSQAPFLKVPHHIKSVAGCITNTLCGTVDFPQIVESAYSGDARLFLTIGPRASCSTWIDTILRDQPHAAIPIDHPGTSTANGLTRAIARLLTHRVEFDQSALSANV
ncbi:MAG: hypothetical protein NT013_09355 [Planctomycetia bacterium]|nr:hypothetical protein [Planctomycetia bacterium]